MALTDDNSESHSRPLLDSNAPAPRTLPEIPLGALARLPELHGESADALRLAGVLKGAVPAAAALMILAALILGMVADTSLALGFGWAMLVLIAVIALLRSYIHSTAAAFDRAPLGEAAKDLRAILLYAGFAWGAGAFLTLSEGGPPLILFAGLPSLAMVWLLDDPQADLAFALPVTGFALAAALIRPGALASVVLLLVLQGGIMAFARVRRPADGPPAGLLLR